MKTKILTILILTLLSISIGSAQLVVNEKAENFYKQYLKVYRNNSSGKPEIKSSLHYLDSAVRRAPRVFKYSYALGASYKFLNDYANAKKWYQNSYGLTDDQAEKKNIDQLINYCNTKLLEQQVASRQSTGPGILVSFIMKEGTNELKDDIVDNFPKVLPDIPITESSSGTTELLKNKFRVYDTFTKDEFLVVSLGSQRSAEEHYKKGIANFDNYFKKTYSFQKSNYYITILLTENPIDLIEATNRLYPEAQLKPYVPFLGFYNKKDNLIAATGGAFGYGTLLHELIHAFVNSDFPEAPLWFNEGLATLYERTQWQGNTLKSLPNWRFDRLRASDFSSLEQLVGNINAKRYNLAEIRMLLLYFDQLGKTGELYNFIKTNKDSLNLASCLQHFDLKQSKWEEFISNTLQEYQVEVYASGSSLSNPSEIKYIQLALKKILGKEMKVDGFWGTGSQNALKEFQQKFGLNPDGVLGKQTRATLEREYDKITIK
jgi:hypothetical protein